jgi:ABC-type dipeptide/oligopeptide/nickel transport system ATPase subunit
MDKELIEAQLKNKQILDDYKTWVDQRKQFRSQLDSMGLNEEWLRRKPHKTAQEQRVLVRMIDARTVRPVTPIVSLLSVI